MKEMVDQGVFFFYYYYY